MNSLDQSPPLVHQLSSSDEKIALFRSLFRGREDVYPRRFESRKTGKSGYAPACANEWVRGICEKPRIKCTDCPNRRFLPLTDDVIRWHLSGSDNTGQPFVVGVYPLLQDETCFFLAVGFDSYDRFFPNQDTLPHGGFGNLIALPLQKKARASGNSVFLNEEMVPHADQWTFLSMVQKIGRVTIENLVRDAERKGRVVGV